MAQRAERVREEGVSLADEMSPKERAALLGVIEASRISYARGESVPAETLLEDIDRIIAER